MSIIKPTVGRVVHFFTKFVPDVPEQPLAAIVTKVHNDRLVNLAVFSPDAFGSDGAVRGYTSIPVRHQGQVAPSGPFCEFIETGLHGPSAVAPV